MDDFTLDLSPHHYVKRKGLLSSLNEIIAPFGKSVFILFDPFIFGKYGPSVTETLQERDFTIIQGTLKRNCCVLEGQTWVNQLQSFPVGSVIGMGGGKTIDLAKWVAANLEKPFIAIPTSTATCAAVTGISPLYSPEGTYKYTVVTTPPTITLVDPDILLTQPPRLLAAGMADSMAKWVEAKGMRKQHHKRIHSASALSIARLIYEFLVRKGTRALEDLEKGQWTETLSEVTDICLITTGFVSTIGGKAVRVSAAHAFQDAFIGRGVKKDVLHGELVAFGQIVQMILEKVGDSLIHRHLLLFKRWRLPLTLEALGIQPEDASFEIAVDRMFEKNSPLHNLYLIPSKEEVRAAILKADALGKNILA